MLYNGVTLAYCPFVDQLSQTLLEVKPTVFVSVPRVYEKIHTQADIKAKAFPKNLIFRWALAVGRAHAAETLKGETPNSPACKSTGIKAPTPTPSNRPPDKTQANCRKYCGVLTSALIHFATPIAEKQSRRTRPRHPVPLGVEVLWLLSPCRIGDSNGDYWPNDEQNQQLQCTCQPQEV